MKLVHIQKKLFLTVLFLVSISSVSIASSAQTSNPSSGNQDGLKDLIQTGAAVVGVAGGLFGLWKYLSEKREKEVREWQKVVIYRMLQQERENDDFNTLTFAEVRQKYLNEAQTLRDFNISKKEISDDALQRVLLELSSSGILVQAPSGSFKLKVPQEQEKREKELREWQKVVIYRIFQEEGELQPLSFSRVQEKYLDKAQTLRDFNLSKKEISEDALQRVLLELSSSGILTLVPNKSFQLKVKVPQLDIVKRNEEFNLELTKVIGSHPFVFTIEEVAFKIGEKLKLEPLLCQGSIIAGINAGFLKINDDRKIAFASAVKNVYRS